MVKSHCTQTPYVSRFYNEIRMIVFQLERQRFSYTLCQTISARNLNSHDIRTHLKVMKRNQCLFFCHGYYNIIKKYNLCIIFYFGGKKRKKIINAFKHILFVFFLYIYFFRTK